MIDSHCHLEDERFSKAKLEQTLANACKDAGC